MNPKSRVPLDDATRTDLPKAVINAGEVTIKMFQYYGQGKSDASSEIAGWAEKLETKLFAFSEKYAALAPDEEEDDDDDDDRINATKHALIHAILCY